MSRYTLKNKHINRLVVLLMLLMLLLPLVPAVSAAEFSGTCGENLSWTFQAGTLTITGSGEMTDYDPITFAPWYPYRDKIVRLELPEGLTSVGDLAFYDCTMLATIVLPSTVRRVGDLAFCQCKSAAILSLNDGLKEIGKNAFEQCRQIQSLRIPNSVIQIGREAFFMCDAVQYVTVPENVVILGDGAFAYCEGLLRAEIKAPLTELPDRTFYSCGELVSISLTEHTTQIGEYSVHGCTALDVVYYDGEPGKAEDLKNQIDEEANGFGSLGEVTPELPQNSENGFSSSNDENGDLIIEDTIVTQTENTTISTTISSNMTNPEAEPISTKIKATIYNRAGWEELLEQIDELGTDETIYITVYVLGDTQLPEYVIDALTGKRIVMTVISETGAVFVVDFANIRATNINKTLDLSYVLNRVNETEHELLQGMTVYKLRFNGSGTIDAEVLVQLPMDHVRRMATLFQEKDGELLEVQSVMTDKQAIAHFYMGAVDKNTVYYIAVDLPTVKTEDVIIPQELEKDFGITEQINNVDYVITGRKSSWGIGFLEVNQILLGIMLSTAAFEIR